MSVLLRGNEFSVRFQMELWPFYLCGLFEQDAWQNNMWYLQETAWWIACRVQRTFLQHWTWLNYWRLCFDVWEDWKVSFLLAACRRSAQTWRTTSHNGDAPYFCQRNQWVKANGLCQLISPEVQRDGANPNRQEPTWSVNWLYGSTSLNIDKVSFLPFYLIDDWSF